MADVTDVVVVGGGIAGMVAALECAKLGLRVQLLSDPLSDPSVRSISLEGIDGIDTAAETFSADDAIDNLAESLGLEREILSSRHTLLDSGVTLAEMPANVFAGVPGNPLSDAVATFAPGAKFRAYTDRVMPFMKIGKTHNLGALVEQRLGKRIANSFTDPYCRAIYGLPADRVDIERAGPGFNSTITSLGTLSGAALALSSNPRSQIRIDGGMARLVEALRTQLENYAVEWVDARITTVENAGETWILADGDNRVWRALTVIVTVDPASIGWPRPETTEPLSTERTVLTALAHVGEGDDRPATGILWARHSTLSSASRPAARSTNLAHQLGQSSDIIRVVTTRRIDVAEHESLVFEAAAELGMNVVSILAIDRADWNVMRPWVALDDPSTEQVVQAEDGSLEWAGQWVVGPGLATVATNARDVAHRIRRIAIERHVTHNA